MKNRKPLSAFKKGLLVYIGVFLLAALTALSVLYCFLRAYEQSRPENTVKEYIQSLAIKCDGEAAENTLAELDTNIRPAEESISILKDELKNLSFRKDSVASTHDELIYNLYSGDRLIGSLKLENSDRHSFGLRFWELAEEKLDYSKFFNSVSMTLPSDFSLSVNGQELGEKYITQKDIEYNTLSGFYPHYNDLPTLVLYESGKFLGDADITVKDGSGNQVDTSELNETRFLSNCDEDTVARISQFADEFISRYVFFCANTNQNEYANHDYLKELVKPDSPLTDRMYNAFWAFGYSTVYSCDIVSRNINLVSDLGGRYLVDYSYTTETVASAGPVQEDSNVRFLVSDNDGTLLAEAIFNY